MTDIYRDMASIQHGTGPPFYHPSQRLASDASYSCSGVTVVKKAVVGSIKAVACTNYVLTHPPPGFLMSHMSHTHRGMITCRSGSDRARAVAAAAADDDDDARRSGKTWARGGRGTPREGQSAQRHRLPDRRR